MHSHALALTHGLLVLHHHHHHLTPKRYCLYSDSLPLINMKYFITSPMRKLRKTLSKPKKTRSITRTESNPSSDTPTSVQAFHMIDSDGDGKITRQQLHTLLSRLGEQDLMKLVGGDNWCITSDEFCRGIGEAFAPPACDAEVRETFDFFDSDGDGKITAEELYEVFRAINGDKCTLDDCRKMIGGVDRNGNGFVCFEDFRSMMDGHVRY